MSKICSITGKRPKTGNNVSHANNKTKRRFLPNIQKKKFWLKDKGTYLRLKVSTEAIRMIDKLGIEAVLARKAKKNLTK